MELMNPEDKVRRVRIFISSPGDVEDERDLATYVVQEMQKEFAGRLIPEPVRWEQLPLLATTSFQQGIDVVLAEGGIDVAIFILWARMGSPLGEAIRKEDGTEYRSGTEREYDVMIRAAEKTKGAKPKIMIFRRRDHESWKERLPDDDEREKRNEMFRQREEVEKFWKEITQHAATGANKAAHHPYVKPEEFRAELWLKLRALLEGFAGDAPGTPVWDIETQGSPFLGLDAFEVKHAPVFFGREDEIIAIRQLLRKQARLGRPFVLIAGASGSGKSSLACAGVLPTVAAYEGNQDGLRWRMVILTPGTDKDPLLTLAKAVAAELVPAQGPGTAERIADFAQKLARDLASDPEQACRSTIKPALEAAALRGQISNAALKKAALKVAGLHGDDSPVEDGFDSPHRLLILVDQMEELFTVPAITPAKREAFMRAVKEMVSGQSRCAWAVATVRSDFYAECQTIPDLVELKAGGGQYDLLPPGAPALGRLIRQPAKLAGLRFEERAEDQSAGVTKKSLADVILDHASAHRELLPLLEYLLQQLFNRRRGNLLTFSAYYDELGGFEQALARCADDAIAGLRTSDANLEKKLNVLLAALVTTGVERDSYVRRRVSRTELEEKTSADLVARLIGARLLTSSGDSGEIDGGTVTVAHEALFRVWKPAIDWLVINREFVRVHKHVADRMNQWRTFETGATGDGAAARTDSSMLLQEGRELNDARTQYVENRSLFDREECEFIARSLEAVEERHWKAAIATGDEAVALEAWKQLGGEYSCMRDRVAGELIKSGTPKERRCLAFLLGKIPGHPLTEELKTLVLKDDEPAVRRAAAYSIICIDNTAMYREIAAREDTESLRALARLLVAADMQAPAESPAPNFYNWYRTVPRRLRERIRIQSWALRFVTALPVYIAVPLPAVFLALVAAMSFKWLPGSFNYAYAQAAPSPVMSIFHGAIASILIGGCSSLGLTIYRMVFGREHVRTNYIRPVGAILTGMLFGLIGGVLCDMVIDPDFPDSLHKPRL
jgi:hypothetical protein